VQYRDYPGSLAVSLCAGAVYPARYSSCSPAVTHGVTHRCYPGSYHRCYTGRYPQVLHGQVPTGVTHRCYPGCYPQVLPRLLSTGVTRAVTHRCNPGCYSTGVTRGCTLLLPTGVPCCYPRWYPAVYPRCTLLLFTEVSPLFLPLFPG